jgi:hypothetical protein
VDENNANNGANKAKTSYNWKLLLQKHFHFFSFLLNCVCCEIFVQCIDFWDECSRLMSSVLFFFLHDFHCVCVGVKKHNL